MAVPARTLSDLSLGALTFVGLVVACLSEETPVHADAGTLGATGAPSSAQSTTGAASSAETTVAVGSTEGDSAAERATEESREASAQRWD
ncbi:MAG: hypothetical protein EOO73_18180 [Myxococcales bacterium]|nr:MAG: hypothetical protein EOO73_18180 [Myxococcales bacterium]